jgi:transcriptional regulator with XRE-family HTH domain
MDSMTTGKFIARLRKEKKLTQSELADLLQVTDKAISRWETGEGMPEVSLLPRLASILNVSIDEILAGCRKEEQANVKNEFANKSLMMRFNTFSFMSVIIISVGLLLSICLIYLTNKVWWGMISFIVTLMAGIIFYLFRRVLFLIDCQYDDNDKKMIFQNTRNVYVASIISLAMLMPFYVINPEIAIGNRLYLKGILTFNCYLLYALLFGLGGCLISYITYKFHQNHVYHTFKHPISKKFIIMSIIEFVLLVTTICILIDSDEYFPTYNYLIIVIVFTIGHLVAMVMKKITVLQFIKYFVLYGISVFMIFYGSVFYPELVLLISLGTLITILVNAVIVSSKKRKSGMLWTYVHKMKNDLFVTLLLTLSAYTVFLLDTHRHDFYSEVNVYLGIILFLLNITWVVLDLYYIRKTNHTLTQSQSV